jgi:hypothetical protein
MTGSIPHDPPSDSQAPETRASSPAPTAPPVGKPSQVGSQHYAVQFVPLAGRVSEAQQAEATAILEGEFGDFERFRQSLPKEPPPKIRKTVPMWFAGAAKSVDFVALMNETLQRVGYAPIGRTAVEDLSVYGFRATWSSPEVEHFLAFRSWGRPNQFIDADVGLRHPPAEAFAHEMMLRYLPAGYRDIYASQPAWECALHFDLGDPAGWPKASLDSSAIAQSDFPPTVDAAVRKCVVAQFQDVCDCGALFELAIGDKAPFPWRPWGASSRVAMTAYLGRKLGRDAGTLKSALTPHVGRFKSPPCASAPSAEEFVDRTLTEADAALEHLR